MGAAIDIQALAASRDLDLQHPSFQRLKPKALALALQSENALSTFYPKAIPQQRQVLKLVRSEHDYSTGKLEIMLSGSYGSSKSIIAAHLIVTHCLGNKRARVAIVRRALPDLKETLFKEILEHLEGDALAGRKGLVEGRDYWVNRTRGSIRFKNKSEIVPVFWADKKYKRPRSLKLSMAVVEEAAENTEQDKEGFLELSARLERLPHVKENVLLVLTNPDSPKHWLHEYFIENPTNVPNRHVFYSRTEDNPYLRSTYVAGLRRSMDPKRAKRYLDGEWVELDSVRPYYAYSDTENFIRDRSYQWDPRYPIHLAWDFNIGAGKPLSMCIFQYIDDVFHFGAEIVCEGFRTQDSLDELAERGFLDMECPFFVVHGDAAGKHKDTRNRRNDYEIIYDFLANYKTKDGREIAFEKQVPLSNPTVRSRHNRVNSYFLNREGERRLFVYRDCPMLNKGFRLVELKKGSDYIEDDSKDYQHVTTAAGYGIKAVELWANVSKQGSRSF